MWTCRQSWRNLLAVFSHAWSSQCVMIQFNHPKQRPVLWNVSSVFCTVYHESCASEPDLEFHHVNFVTKLMYVLWHKPINITWTPHLNFVMKLMYVLWHKPSNFTWTPHLNFVTKLMYVLWHKPSNFTWTSNFTAVFVLIFSPTCLKAKFRRKMISIHTNSFIIITCPNPVLLVPGFGQVG